MLANLTIENLAVIERISIDFDRGLNVLTGETGAGKSILIDAINAVVGQRVSKEIVRVGANKAVISAVFTDFGEEIARLLAEYGFEAEEDTLILQREIQADGKSTARINARPATVGVLRELGAHLINIHGQQDTQTLMSAEQHLRILDAYAELEPERDAFSEAFRAYRKLCAELDAVCTDDAQKAQQMDLLRYQIQEIEGANLLEGEDEALAVRQKAIRNSTRIVSRLSRACESFFGSNDYSGAVDLLSDASADLADAREVYEDVSDLSERLESLSIEVSEAAAEVRRHLDDFAYDPAELNEIESRLDEIYKLKRKYGNSVAEILQFLERARTALDEIVTSDERREALTEQVRVAKAALNERALALRRRRQAAAKRLIDAVADVLRFLNMPHIELSAAFTETELYAYGADRIEFLISTNPGEPPKPVSKIASGGELSRIMLAIKTTLADKDFIDTLIFDEIDSGVSGRAAEKIGLKLREVGGSRQVLCVTHSAQIAALADVHLLLSKRVADRHTYTEIEKLDLDGRKRELARIIGMNQITKLTLDNAEEMLKFAGNA